MWQGGSLLRPKRLPNRGRSRQGNDRPGPERCDTSSPFCVPILMLINIQLIDEVQEAHWLGSAATLDRAVGATVRQCVTFFGVKGEFSQSDQPAMELRVSGPAVSFARHRQPTFAQATPS